ncbi:hypothetical protein HK098_004512 [Nowakowskiella sp. JEL0407]|nr:hypothetical protein HK098_004512 [Nowakowskiella sp. JEL0407]
MATTANSPVGVTNWKNVNNWHWVEKNCLPWAKEYLTSQLKNLSASDAGSTVSISSIFEISGDVHVNQRKGKIITIYDIMIDMRWIGNVILGENADGETTSGELKIPEYEHDTSPKDIPFEYTVDDSSIVGKLLLDLVKSQLVPKIREKLSSFATDLRENHAKDVHIAPEDMKGHPVVSTYQPKPPARETTKTSQPLQSKTIKGKVVKIKQTIEFTASASDIYETLTNPQRVAIWTRSRSAKIAPEVGSEFVLFDGNVSGSFLELVPNKKIVMKWKLKSWPIEHFSTVTIALDQGDDVTMLQLDQTDIPIGEKEITENNWTNYYWNAIKGTFGYAVKKESFGTIYLISFVVLALVLCFSIFYRM